MKHKFTNWEEISSKCLPLEHTPEEICEVIRFGIVDLRLDNVQSGEIIVRGISPPLFCDIFIQIVHILNSGEDFFTLGYIKRFDGKWYSYGDYTELYKGTSLMNAIISLLSYLATRHLQETLRICFNEIKSRNEKEY